MNKTSTIVIGCLLIIGYILSKIETPMIALPKGAQHNTFGELPVVEVWDDLGWFEADGEEYTATKEGIFDKNGNRVSVGSGFVYFKNEEGDIDKVLIYICDNLGYCWDKKVGIYAGKEIANKFWSIYYQQLYNYKGD